MQQNKRTYYYIITAILAALTTIMTMIIQIPTAKGYLNLGDAVLMLGGMLLGPQWGFLIGGVGSAMADFLSGYSHYVIPTFIIKGIEGLIVGYLFQKFNRRLLATVPAGLWMMVGYFVNALIMYNIGTAVGSLFGNFMQGMTGAIIATLLYPIIRPAIRQLNR